MGEDKQERIARYGTSEASKKKKSEKAAWMVDFVSITLTAEDKRNLAKQPATPPDIVSFFQSILELGFKVTLSIDADHDAVIASMTGTDMALKANRKKCLTARGADMMAAVQALAYKWYVIVGGETFDDVGGGDDDYSWG